MTEIFAGIRVLDVAQNTFGPAAAGVLSDFGADVIKVEHPTRGDPQRGLVTAAIQPSVGGMNLGMAQVNRGKRSIGLDLTSDKGREILYELVRTSDVFLTNFLPRTTSKLKMDEQSIRQVQPSIIYARATGQGPKGPDIDKPAYDATVYWGRGAIGAGLQSSEPGARPPKPLPAFGDRAGAMNMAFGIAAALLRRERTGEGATVDVSLLSTAMYQNSSTAVYSLALNQDWSSRRDRVTNPLSHTYRTKDGRWLTLCMLESDRVWPGFCDRIGRPELTYDRRFCDSAARGAHSAELVAVLEDAFVQFTLDEWRRRFVTLNGAWEPMQTVVDLPTDPQVIANNYLVEVDVGNGVTTRLIPPPVQFDGRPPQLRRAAEFSENGEEILLELGYSWSDIGIFKNGGVIP
jgi:crotonobetainyl-CoA:carnitine CoA-transferase CaiB-like acyl-CoA transferase